MITQIIFVLAYVTALINYFFSETSGNFPRRAINKTIMATMFLLYAFSAQFLKGVPDWSGILLLAAFFVAWVGDVILLWSFKIGGIAFMVSNLMFFAYEIYLAFSLNISFARLWWAAIIFILAVGTMAVLYFTKKIRFEHVGALMLLYLATVSLHGSLGVALACTSGEISVAMLGGGLALFMCSDYFLTVNKFVHKRNWVLRCNSGTYFIGMMLAAMSLSF